MVILKFQNIVKIKQLFKIGSLAIAAFFVCAFNRADYGNGWLDVDRDCQDAREEILISESLEPVVLDNTGCKVIKGLWFDNYSGIYYSNPSKLDIDHLVPLAEVDRSGGSKWTKEKKLSYANDLSRKETLIAVSASQNRAKGDKDPSQWMPENKSYHCTYLKNWQKVKSTWKLNSDKKEKKFIESKSKNCI